MASPQGKRQDASSFFASKAATMQMPRRMQDTLYYTATSFDFSDEVQKRGERAENMQETFQIGGHNNKFLPHPGSKVPLLTHASCSYNRSFRGAPPGDIEENRQVLNEQKMSSGGGIPPPTLELKKMASTYGEDFADTLSPEARQNARGVAVKGLASLGGGRMHWTLSSTQEAYGGPREGAPCFSPSASSGFRRSGNLGPNLIDPAPVIAIRSRYQMEHCCSEPSSPAAKHRSPSSPLASPSRRHRAVGGAGAGAGGAGAGEGAGRRRRRRVPGAISEGAVRQLLEQSLQSNLKASRSVPSIHTVPISQIGNRTF